MHWSNKDLTVRLFITLFLLGLTIFSVLIGINLHSSAKNILADNENSIYMNVSQSSRLITEMTKEMEQTAKKIALNSSILFSGDKKLISDYLYQIYNISPNTIQNLYFYYDGSLYSGQQALLDIYGNEYLESAAKDIEYAPYIVWGDPYSTLISQNTISLFYCIGDKEDYGILFIDLNCSLIENHFTSVYSDSGMDYLILSNQSNLPIRSNLSHIGMNGEAEMLSDKLALLSYQDGHASVFSYGNVKYGVFESIPHQAFRFYVIFPRNIFENLKPLIYNSLLAILGTVSLLLFASYWIASKITAPINQFTRELKQAYHKNRLPDTINNIYSGEVFEMVESYNELALRIRAVVDEKERTLMEKNTYEKQILQHQIGPHFLHNTLICIGSLVKQNRTSEVVSTLQALLKLLSYSFDNPQELVPLKYELDSVASFVQILQTRYSQEFKLIQEVSDDCLDFQVPRLILQPIVENAIYHGIIPKQVPGEIHIRTVRDESFFFIDISDNGVGIEDAAEKIGQKNKEQNRNFSIGLANVIKRVRLQYGEGSDVEFITHPGEGTTVRLKLSTEDV